MIFVLIAVAKMKTAFANIIFLGLMRSYASLRIQALRAGRIIRTNSVKNSTMPTFLPKKFIAR
jgi:hypothetical protein